MQKQLQSSKNSNHETVANPAPKQISFKQQSSIYSTAYQLPFLNTMTKSYNFNINQALDYTCHRQLDNDKAYDFCGTCNSCQIIKYLNNMKQWFYRASQMTIKKFLIGLLVRVNNVKIYKYLNDLLKPITESKDFVYARNKFLPSCDEDHLKLANNRCLDNDYVNRQINFIWNWYSSSNNFIKQNFMLSILSKCEQALVFHIITQLKSILESAQASMNDIIKEDSLRYDEFRINTPENEMNEPNYNSDTELVCEAYDDDEDEEVKADEEVKSILNQPNQKSNRTKNAKYIDFIRQLPVNISKSILNLLDNKSLSRCLFVCKYWSMIAREVKKEEHSQKQVQDDLMILKGTISRVCNPKYAHNADVKVPNLYPGTYECKEKDNEKKINVQFKSDCTWENAYTGYVTRTVIIEERNVFCGPYNVFALKDRRDPFRVVHLNGNNTIAYATLKKNVNFIDIKTNTESDSGIQGHAGSIKSIYICESKGIVVTGSFDTTIRVWSLETGKCLTIFQGHQGTVTCLSMYDLYGRIISGSNDKTCKIWNIGKKSSWRTFKHSYSVVSLAINEEFCVTGGSTGKIKLFHLLTGSLVKTIAAHQGYITGVKFDKWHIVTASNDGYALVFSAQGKHKKCVIAMRHPKEVTCVEFQYLRAITGCADGKIRIWNIITGDCVRLIRGNSRSDPILSMCIVGQRWLINTENSITLFEFEKIIFEYNGECLIETPYVDTVDNSKLQQKQMPKRKSYSMIRASRMELVSTPNTRLFNDNRQTIIDHSSRPVSGKCLKDARRIYSAVTKSGNSKMVLNNFRTNSAGHISEAALVKRRSIMESINAIISSQGSHHTNVSNLSNYKESDPKVGFVKNSPGISNEELDKARVQRIPSNLKETKQYLRQQLRQIKEEAQNSHSARTTDDTAKSNLNTNQYTSLSGRNKDLETLRPYSSPSRVNTKKIKLKAHQFRDRLEGRTTIDDYDSDEDPVFRKHTRTYISKKFETQEGGPLKTNTGMYPMNVKSKMPTSNFVRPQTSPSKRVEQLPSTFLGSFFTTEAEQSKFLDVQQRPPVSPTVSTNILARSKSAVAPKFMPVPPQLPPRPITSMNHIKIDLIQKENTLVQLNKTFGLATDNLNLKTFKEVDKIVDVINSGCRSLTPNAVKEKEKAEIYKKFWHLKSTGQYHGSLLAKPKVMAPEIRE